VGESVVYDKLTAIRQSESTGHHIQFHTPQYELHHEPEQDLLTLCIQHAKRIREKYDYIRLWYSGGCDSQYMFRAFRAANIHIDEIIMVKCGIKCSEWEIDDVAVPFVREHAHPDTVIRTHTKSIDDYYDFDGFWFDKHARAGRNSRLISGLRLNEHLECINLYDTFGKTVNVLGIDKPKICHVQGKWYAYFLDYYDWQQGTSNNDFCCFFDDDPLIYAKQCHMLRRGIENSVQPDCYNSVQKSHHFERLLNECTDRVSIGEYFIPYANNHHHATIPSFNKKELDAKLYMLEHHPQVMEHYYNGIEELRGIGTRWWNNGDPESGPVLCLSQFMCMSSPGFENSNNLFPDGFNL
jgi:hypothetical protein